jgi:hypothetical protein
MTHDHDSHAPAANLGRAFAFGIALMAVAALGVLINGARRSCSADTARET